MQLINLVAIYQKCIEAVPGQNTRSVIVPLEPKMELIPAQKEECRKTELTRLVVPRRVGSVDENLVVVADRMLYSNAFDGHLP